MNPPASRREFLKNAYLGLGSLALMDLLATNLGASAGSAENPLLPKPAHLPAKAKHCIFLFMEGGVSQMDTFEYRPALDKFAGQQMPSVRGTDLDVASLGTAHNRIIPSPFSFARHGQSGRWMSELLPHLSTCVDDMAFLHGVTVDSSNHAPAVYHSLTGQILPGGAAIGAWMTYGLGSENQNLPGFIVLGQGAPAVGGASQWSQGFLPATHQGTLFRPGSNPIVDLHPRAGTSPESQRGELDLLKWLNQRHARQRSHTGELEARIAAYEMAFQMADRGTRADRSLRRVGSHQETLRAR